MSHTRLACARSALRITIVFGALSFMCVSPALARTAKPATVAEMTTSAERVFRGHCTAVTVGTVDVAGARLPATTYTFHVDEHLKGRKVRTVTFRQLGTPDGGPRDLGRLAELPAYAAG